MDEKKPENPDAKAFAMTFKFDWYRVQWLKTHAKGLRRSVTSIIEEALDDYQARQDKPTKAQKPRLPAHNRLPSL